MGALKMLPEQFDLQTAQTHQREIKYTLDDSERISAKYSITTLYYLLYCWIWDHSWTLKQIIKPFYLCQTGHCSWCWHRPQTNLEIVRRRRPYRPVKKRDSKDKFFESAVNKVIEQSIKLIQPTSIIPPNPDLSKDTQGFVIRWHLKVNRAEFLTSQIISQIS